MQNDQKRMTKGGFTIRKWASNFRQLTETISAEMREAGDDADELHNQKLTKRTQLSNIATIFDVAREYGLGLVRVGRDCNSGGMDLPG